MLKNNRLIMFILIVLGVFLLAGNVYAANDDNICKNYGCPCLKDDDGTFSFVEISYTNEQGLGVTLESANLEEWKNVSSAGDRASAKFFYKRDKGTLVLHTQLVRFSKTRNNYLLERKNVYAERGYKCKTVTPSWVGVTITNPVDNEDEGTDVSQYTCEQFQSKNVYQKFIAPAYIIIRVIVPILIVVLCTKDLVGAVVSQKAEDMQKAQKTLVTRIIIGVIIMILPTIIDALWNLANITYGTCGIG